MKIFIPNFEITNMCIVFANLSIKEKNQGI